MPKLKSISLMFVTANRRSYISVQSLYIVSYIKHCKFNVAI